MRPLRLDLRGFAVFREPTTIDFTDTDFFALVGPTGSGKSTVLDAICFALYGAAPRWGGGKAVGYALAPSANEAAVRLIFEASGARYAATRVVRRDGKGKASTRAAGLQALSPGFDPSILDGDGLLDELGEAIAGTPAELDSAVAEVVGLPYDQFIKCVILPQGQFQAFLHARPAERQEILVRLLGLSVYERVREKATGLVAAADVTLKLTESQLAELTAQAGDDALSTADAAVQTAQGLVTAVDAALPTLAAARERLTLLSESVSEVDRRLTVLGRVRTPAEVTKLAANATQTAAAAADAAIAVGAAEEREEKSRAQLDAAPDPARLTRMLDAYTERDRIAAKLSTLDSTVKARHATFIDLTHSMSRAKGQLDQAQGKLSQAQEALIAAQTSDRAAWLRRDLVAGHACPVCEQQVTTVPAMPDQPAMNVAKQRLTTAEERLATTRAELENRDADLREAERQLVAAETQQQQLAGRMSEMDTLLAQAPAVEQIRAELKSVEALRRELSETATRLRSAREAQRAAATAAQQAEERLRKGWRDFDTARDAVASLAPPAADREDLGRAWVALSDWAAAQGVLASEQRGKLSEELTAAQTNANDLVQQLDALFLAAGLPKPRPGEHQRAAAVTVERANSARDRIVQMRQQADTLRAQRAEVESERQVATALANHLRANNFEAWILQEALDALVGGASTILRELSQGQYDLIHEDREFYVVDHHDAGLRRAVRTLSGGETFQASLALALALAEQLGGLSSTASLESIMLDEGFGTLDASTLDTVAATLENLAANGDRMVGVVTHVSALAERIPVRFEISKDARSARVERIG